MLMLVKKVKNASRQLGTSAMNALDGCCVIGILLVLHLFTVSNQSLFSTEVLNTTLEHHIRLHCLWPLSLRTMFGTLQTLRRTDSACNELEHFLNAPGPSLSYRGVLWLETSDQSNVKTEVQYSPTDGIDMHVRSITPQIQLWPFCGDWAVELRTYYPFSTLHSLQAWYIIVVHVIWSVAPKSTGKTGTTIAKLCPIFLFPTFIEFDWVGK